jgi:hypothetical protein
MFLPVCLLDAELSNLIENETKIIYFLAISSIITRASLSLFSCGGSHWYLCLPLNVSGFPDKNKLANLDEKHYFK